MAITTTLKYTVDLDKGGLREVLRSPLSTLNSKAHVFAVTITQGGAAAGVSGAACRAWFIRADGVTVPIDGTISGSVASVTLLPNCYAVQGRFELAVELTMGDVIHTILHVDGSILRTRTDSLTTGGSAVQSFDRLVSAVQHVDAAISKRDRVFNLLDNSDFRHPVNQRGAASYTGASYSIDRWRAYHTDTTHTVTEAGVAVSSTGSNPNIYQVLDAAKISSAKTYTAAACDSTGKIYTWTGQPTSSPAGAICVYYNTSNTLLFRLYGAVTWVWAALYEGSYTADTLPTYQPRGYAAELAECQRYYRQFGTIQLPLTITTGAWGAAAIDYTSMRVTPTVTFDLAGLYVGNTMYTTVTGITPRTKPESELVINIGASVAANQTGTIRFNSLALSSDL